MVFFFETLVHICLIGISIALLPGFTCDNATKEKTAYYDYQKVMEGLPTAEGASRDLEAFASQGYKMIEEMEKAIEDHIRLCDTIKPHPSSCHLIPVDEMYSTLEEKKENPARDIRILSDRLFDPIRANLERALENVAKAHHVERIDSNRANAFIPAAGAIDLTKEVRKELLRLEKERTVHE